MSCAENCGVQKYFLLLSPFLSHQLLLPRVRLSQAPFDASTANGTQQVCQVGKVVRALNPAKKGHNVVSTDLLMLHHLMLASVRCYVTKLQFVEYINEFLAFETMSCRLCRKIVPHTKEYSRIYP